MLTFTFFAFDITVKTRKAGKCGSYCSFADRQLAKRLTEKMTDHKCEHHLYM
ncbi:hypothetical protein [Bacillus marinisedimentorum]|uniref:hypothetical protein n=1 Tax=Bacillus marinisedimentorum TaxID=1821260 RepID=UPI0012FF818D|nr:hypothetical protein [Bacillus marinisedimentorum]